MTLLVAMTWILPGDTIELTCSSLTTVRPDNRGAAARLQLSEQNVMMVLMDTTVAQLNPVNDALHDRLVSWSYPSHGEGHRVERVGTFKGLKINKQGGLYISCVEVRRDGETHERFKNYSLCKVSDFDLASWIDRVRVFIHGVWTALRSLLGLCTASEHSGSSKCACGIVTRRHDHEDTAKARHQSRSARSSGCHANTACSPRVSQGVRR